MDYNQRERLTNRFLAGQIRISNGRNTYIVHNVSPELKYEASELYFDALGLASYFEIMTDEELKVYLLKNKLWDKERQMRLDLLPKEIEDCKVGIYETMTKGKDRAMHRETLKNKLAEFERLYTELHTFDYMSRTGYAEYIKSKFIISKSVSIPSDTDVKFECLLGLLNHVRISEKEYRELARTDPWRQYWVLGKSFPIWSYPICQYSDEQRQICSWSKMYDNIYEGTECPHDSVLTDDDMLDGWLITNRRKREKDALQKQGDEMISGNAKIRGAGEIFIVCQTREDADRVDSLNDAYARSIKQQRLLQLKERGDIKEQDLPDIKGELMMQSTRMMVDRIKGK
jgi:hypothetical protein